MVDTLRTLFFNKDLSAKIPSWVMIENVKIYREKTNNNCTARDFSQYEKLFPSVFFPYHRLEII